MDTETKELQQRFTQLAQHSFRVKISILILLIVSLFVVWSTLTAGTQKAEQVDKNFCHQLSTDSYYSSKVFFGEYSCASSLFFRITIEHARHSRDNDPPEPDTTSVEDRTRHINEMLNHFREFQDYDWNRRQAYSIELSLPYAKTAVLLNGALISAVWPFCALLVLSIAIALGLRQACYEIHLSFLVAGSKPEDDHGRNVALTEFLAGEISEAKLAGKSIFLYKKPIGLIPETVVSGVLYIAVSLLSLNLLTDYSPQFTERGSELLSDSYYLWLYLFAVVLFLLLLKTRRLWRSSLYEALGREVRSRRLFFLFESLEEHSEDHPLSPKLIYLLVGMFVASLFLHWESSYRGFVLLCCPNRVFDDAPIAGRFVQVQMLLITGFMGATIILTRKRHVHPDWFRFALQKIRSFGARYILVVVGFLDFYRFIGNYGYIKDYYVWPIVGNVTSEAYLNLANLPILDLRHLTIAGWLFLGSCQILAFAEIWFETKQKRERSV
jgi:hypothetical protein